MLTQKIEIYSPPTSIPALTANSDLDAIRSHVSDESNKEIPVEMRWLPCLGITREIRL